MRRLVLLSVVLFAALAPFVALAQVTGGAPAVSPLVHTIIEIFGSIVTVASVLANVFPPNTIAAKLLHFLALNGPTIQNAVVTVTDNAAKK